MKYLFMIFIFYSLLIIWRVHLGATETPSVSVDHFSAGACDLYFIALAVSFLGITISSAILFLKYRGMNNRVLLLAVAMCSTYELYYPGFLQEKFGSDYSEAVFKALVSNTEHVNRDKVLKALGRPLFVANTNTSGEQWGYSYMPSTGFGWHKRIFVFSANGELESVNQTDEP